MRTNRFVFRFLVSLAVTVIFTINTAAIAEESFKVNINTASKEQLMTLDGVGETVASRIIVYREGTGSFKTPEDIMKVKGVGPKTFKMNKDRILVKMSNISMKKE